jgi:hypothetical protein
MHCHRVFLARSCSLELTTADEGCVYVEVAGLLSISSVGPVTLTACPGYWIHFRFLNGCPTSVCAAVHSVIAAYVLLVGAFVADATVHAGERVFSSGLVHRSLRPLALPPESRVAGRFHTDSALLMLRPKFVPALGPQPLRGKARSSICFFSTELKLGPNLAPKLIELSSRLLPDCGSFHLSAHDHCSFTFALNARAKMHMFAMYRGLLSKRLPRAVQQTFCSLLLRTSARPKTLLASQTEFSRNIKVSARSGDRFDGMPFNHQTAPTLSLCCVALLWATFGPCLRLLYAGDGV